eukprot:COSAG01_NODE_719_length_14073_cov_30.141906_6_plen_142_part_00
MVLLTAIIAAAAAATGAAAAVTAAAAAAADPNNALPPAGTATAVEIQTLRVHEIRLARAQQAASNEVNRAAVRSLPLLQAADQVAGGVPAACCGLPPGPPPPPSAQCRFSPLWRFEMPPFLLADGERASSRTLSRGECGFR